jgi:PAS domain S-box-containing protein
MDVRTLIAVLGLTHVIQVGVFLQQYRQKRSYPGVGWWLLWSTTAAAGFVFLLLRQNPAFLAPAILFQNTGIVLGVIFVYVGVQRFFGRPLKTWRLAGLFGTFTAALAYFIFVRDNIDARTVVLCATLTLIAFGTALALWRADLPHVREAARGNAVVCVLHGLLFAHRGALIALGRPVGDVFAPTLFSMAPYLDGIVVGLLWTYGFVLMVNQRLQGETMDAREQLELIFNTGPDAAMISRLPDGLIVSVNDAFSELFGYARDEVVGRTTPEVHIWAHPSDRDAVLQDMLTSGFCSNHEVALMTKDGARVTAILSAKRLVLNGEPHVISVARDITDYKAALAEVTALSGMLPICMHCKQIRNDAGYWEQIEAYISSRSEAQFSHGICPTCMAKHYPDAGRAVCPTPATLPVQAPAPSP